tara:strand:- start:327 stop:1514 length:1188 start_codon:yes stop_codon:yes gene_type:complete
MKRLSDAAYRLEGQEMFQILAKAQGLEREGKDILHFELGDPDFDTPSYIVDAACSSLRKGDTHYVNSSGLLELRTAVADKMEKHRGFRPDANQLLVTAGANTQIYYALQCAINPGEEVIVPDPAFVSYFSIMNLLDIKAKKVPLSEDNEFRLNPDDVEAAITSNTKMIIINSPSNPTGALMTNDEMRRIYEIAKEKDLWLLSDEIYARMNYRDKRESFFSPTECDQGKERTILVHAFSKSYAMTGWRLGVCMGPSDLIAKMGLCLETISSCVPPFIQKAGIEALKGSQSEILGMREEYRKRRDVIVDGLNSLPGVSCLNPKGAFYAFPNIQGTGKSSREFADFMLDEAGVALTPGTIFGEQGEGYVRLSYCCSVDNIKRGIERMKGALDDDVVSF